MSDKKTEAIETMVLAGCMTGLIKNIRSKIKPEFFDKIFHKKIFETLNRFYTSHQIAMSRDALLASFENENKENIVELEILLSKAQGVLDESLILQRVDDLRKSYQQRELKKILSGSLADPDIDFDKVSQEIRKEIVKIESLVQEHERVFSLSDSAFSDEIIKESKKTVDEKQLLPFGLETIDDVLLPAGPGMLYTYAAISGHGKTTALLNHAHHIATVLKKNVVFAQVEMSDFQISNAYICLHAHKTLGMKGIDKAAILGSYADSKMLEQFAEAATDIQQNPDYGKVHFIQAAHLTIVDIHIMAEEINKESPISAVFVDYFERLKPIEKKHTAHQEETNDTFRYGEFIKNHFNKGQGVFVCTGHQVNREGMRKAGDKKSTGELELYHLYMSNQLIFASDAILSFYKADEIDGADSEGASKTERIVKILKNRHKGKQGKKFHIQINEETGSFSSIVIDPSSNGKGSFGRPPELLDFNDEDISEDNKSL